MTGIQKLRMHVAFAVIAGLQWPSDVSAQAWPNEPAGSQLLSDVSFTSLPTTNWGWAPMGLSGGGSSPDISPDATAPLSPSGVLRFTFPIGFQAGGSPGSGWYFDGTKRNEWYVGMWWKQDLNWQPEASGTTKIFFLTTSNSPSWPNIFVGLRGYGEPFAQIATLQDGRTPPLNNSQIPGMGLGTGPLPISAAVPVYGGVWYRIEVYLKASATTTSQDGIFKLWWTPLGGTPTLVSNVTNLNFDPNVIDSVNLTPIYGGGGATKTQTDYYWFDHVHISAPNSGMPPAAPMGLKLLQK